jgi:hypothetical protein
MRRAFAIAALSAMCLAGAAQAEAWKPYSAVSDKGLQWSYDADYSYKDAKTGRVVVLQAIGKPGAEPRMGPSGPGKPDGVGFVYAIDCGAGTLQNLGGYSPKKPLALAADWQGGKGVAAKSADDKALVAAACANVASLPTK